MVLLEDRGPRPSCTSCTKSWETGRSRVQPLCSLGRTAACAVVGDRCSAIGMSAPESGHAAAGLG
jgi:hypothetical protein